MRTLLTLTVSLLLMANAAWAQSDIPPSPIAKATLIVDAPTVKKGQPIHAGVTFTMPEHWHIYWKNPGDSGIPTKLDWTLPEGLSAGEIEWPAPERLEVQGLVNYGYSNTITLPVTLTPQANDVAGEVKVKASWLICREICIPESADLSAMLVADPAGAATLASARALVPQPLKGDASFDVTPDAVALTIHRDNPWGQIGNVRFSPEEDGLVANDPLAEVKHVGNQLTLTMKRGIAPILNDWHGVLHYTDNGTAMAFAIHAKNIAPVAQVAPAGTPSLVLAAMPEAAIKPPLGFATIILFAFLGGLILNIMPCVLPILALKALALQKAAASRTAAMRQGVSYTAGVILSFLLIAGIMLGLKATGSAIGWGFQLQNPAFVAVLALVMLAVSANLLGLFELPVLFGAKATGVNEDKLSGSFLTGVLAVLVATPCTAPFMAPAIGATLLMPPVQALAVFAALGLGMASPFLLISIWPAARRLIPKPGVWMHRFKQILAVPMLATAAWLIWVLVQLINPTPVKMADGYVPYSAGSLHDLRAAGTPVFVDATASWCLSCKVNERVALKPEATQKFFEQKRIVMMVADWTNSDPEITKYLAGFKRNGVPLYVYYPPAGGTPVVLPQVLTPGIVREAIESADAAPISTP